MATYFWRVYRIFILLILLLSLTVGFGFDRLNAWRYQQHIQQWVAPSAPYLIAQLNQYDERLSLAWLELISALTGADWEIYSDAVESTDWQQQQAKIVLPLENGRQLVANVNDWQKFFTGVGLLLANRITQESASKDTLIAKFNQQLPFTLQRLSDDGIHLPFLAQQQWKQGQPVVLQHGVKDQYAIYIPLANGHTLLLDGLTDFKWLTPSALLIMMLVIMISAALMAMVVWLPLRHRLAHTALFVDQVAVSTEPLPIQQYTDDELGDMEYKIACMAERVRTSIFENKQMVKAVSHDLKTPLARMRFALESMPSQMHDSFEWQSIRTNIKRLSEYIDDIILFDGLQSQTHSVDSVDEINVSDDLAALVAQSQQINLHLSIELICEETYFPIRKSHWLRLIGNLLDNAQRYAESKIEIRLIKSDQGLSLSFDNDGPAINKEDEEHIFMPFYRADSARNLKGESYGLGLSVCRSLAGYYNGSFQLEKSRLCGACFVLFIPNNKSGSKHV